ncbi:MAG: DUF4124 domain-containing protein [Pseudomonadales bacterium]
MQYSKPLVALLWFAAVGSAGAQAEIYRSVDPQGVVSYSDQPSPGAQKINFSPSDQSSQSATAAQAAAQARIESELALAERLATDRRERSADRQARALVRAELRESRAREQSMVAEQEAIADSYSYGSLGYYPDYAPYYPRRRKHGHHGRPPYAPGHRPDPDENFRPPTPPRKERSMSRPLPKD